MTQIGTAIELFEQRARENPGATALIYEGERMTYGDLNQRANRLAHYLRKIGVTSGERVGIYMERSPEAVMAILAIMKAGALYVPLDPAYPRARLEHMLTRTTPSVILTKDGGGETFASYSDHLVDVTLDAEEISAEPADPPANERSDEAYVLFTSGSTGSPHGVIGLHQGIVNRIRWMFEHYPLRTNEVFSLRTSLNFVDAVWDIFQPLLAGRPLLIVPEWVMENHAVFTAELQRWGVTRLSIGPSHLRSLLHYDPNLGQWLPQLHILDVTGEQFSGELARLAVKAFPRAVVLNRYGCTEAPSAMIFDAAQFREELHGELVPIGVPIWDTGLFIVGPSGEELDRNEVGELCVSGAQVAASYLGEPDLTQRKFVTITIHGTPTRVYRTGDMARYAVDGNIVCLGREDSQVKIRGNRVELDEVEAVFNTHPAVKQGVIVADCSSGEERLRAFFVARHDGVEAEDLRAWMRAKLPDYMVPGILTPLAQIPLLPNGKIDRKALSNMNHSLPVRQYAPPRTRIEQEICAALKEFCQVDRVGIEDNFFDLGLDSLSAMQLATRMYKCSGVLIPMQAILLESTVSKLAQWVERAEQKPGSQPANTRSKQDRQLPMSYAQRLLWRMDQRLGEWQFLYNDAWAIRLRGDLHVHALQGAFTDLIQRHAVLRTHYTHGGGSELQVIDPPEEFEAELIDISDKGSEEQARLIRAFAEAQRRRPFDLVKGSVIRGQLLTLKPSEHVLLLAMHHIAEDAWSGRVFNRDFSEFYNARVSGESHRLRPLPWSYADFALWQDQEVKRGAWTDQIAYWKRQLQGICARPPGLLDREADIGKSFEASVEVLALSASLVEPVKRLAAEERATLFMALLAVLYAALYRRTGSPDLAVGSPIAHRHYENVRDLIGFFPNMLLFRQRCDSGMTFRELLRGVRQTALEAYANQDVPFAQLADELGAERGPLHPLTTMTFIMPGYNPRVGETMRLHGLTSELIQLQNAQTYAKFDFNLSAVEAPGGMELHMLYNRSVLDADTIRELLESYRTIMSDIARTGDSVIGRPQPVLEGLEMSKRFV